MSVVIFCAVSGCVEAIEKLISSSKRSIRTDSILFSIQEHVLNDIRYPLEMHMIHRNRKYESIDEALAHKDGLTVLGE